MSHLDSDSLPLEIILHISFYTEEDPKTWLNFKLTCKLYEGLLSTRNFEVQLKHSKKLYPQLELTWKGYSDIFHIITHKILTIRKVMDLFIEVRDRLIAEDGKSAKEDTCVKDTQKLFKTSLFLNNYLEGCKNIYTARRITAVFYPIIKKSRCEYRGCKTIREQKEQWCELHLAVMKPF